MSTEKKDFVPIEYRAPTPTPPKQPTPADIAAALGSLLSTDLFALNDTEVEAVLEKVDPEHLRLAFMPFVRRLRAMAQPLRLEAERDGWKEIATTLLKVAIGEDAATYEIPPIELLALVDIKTDAARNPHAVGEVRKLVPALNQWWADLTFKDSERRSKKEHWQLKSAVVGASQMLRNAEKRHGETLQGGPVGRVREQWRIVVDELDRAIAGKDSPAKCTRCRASIDGIEDGAIVDGALLCLDCFGQPTA